MTASDRRRGRAFAVGLLTASVFVSVSASAEPGATERERARELMAQGRERREANDLEGALSSFQEADAIMRVPTTAFEVAATQQMLGRWLEAQATLTELLELPSSSVDPPPFTEARRKALVLAKELAAQIPSVVVVLRSQRGSASRDAVVLVDGRNVPSLDAPYKVNPGAHAVVVRSGTREVTTTVQVHDGESRRVEIEIDAPPPPAEERPARGPTIPTISWVGFGVGAAGLALGSVTGAIALSREGELADRCPDKRCARVFESDLDSAQTMATLSTIGFITLAVGAAAGVVGLLLPRHDRADTGPQQALTRATWSDGLRLTVARSGLALELP